jgi:hypothetical protein
MGRIAVLTFLAEAFVLGCTGMPGESSRLAPFGDPGPAMVFLEVRNPLDESVTVRILSRSLRSDLGVVEARSVATLAFPWTRFGRATFQIEPLSGGRYSFPVKEIRPGGSLEMVIQSPLGSSRLHQ